MRTDLILESIIIVAITAIAMWIVIDLVSLPSRARKATAVVLILWALFWGLRLTRNFMGLPDRPTVGTGRRGK